MTSLDLSIRARAAELAAASEFPDADPRLFLAAAFKEIVRGTLVTAPVEDEPWGWSSAQHCRGRAA